MYVYLVSTQNENADIGSVKPPPPEIGRAMCHSILQYIHEIGRGMWYRKRPYFYVSSKNPQVGLRLHCCLEGSDGGYIQQS